MKCLVFIGSFLPFLIFAQPINEFHSPEKIKLFADFLFCEEDYLRAALEYEKYNLVFEDDSIKFRVGLAYSQIGSYKKAEEIFSAHQFETAKGEYYKALFLQNDFASIEKDFQNNIQSSAKFYYLSFLLKDDQLPSFTEFSSPFEMNESNELKYFYDLKNNPPTKSPLLAAILSAIVPGSGKFYTGEIGDGITALISTGLLAYLSYTNFKADHHFRGWLFAGLGTLFNAGNIYGSAASADIYNANLKISFENELSIFLSKQNYFLPEFTFCK